MMEIPEEIVPKFFIMDPKTDDLLPNAEHLMNGMIVLIEDSSVRLDISKALAEWEEERMDERNYWCRVSYLSHEGPYDTVSSFIAEYHDGTKKKRTFNKTHAWFVKKDSIEDAKEVFDESNKPLAMMNPLVDRLRNTIEQLKKIDCSIERGFANYEHSEEELENYTELQLNVRDEIQRAMISWAEAVAIDKSGAEEMFEEILERTLNNVIELYTIDPEDSDEVERYENVLGLVLKAMKRSIEVTSADYESDQDELPSSLKELARETVLDLYKEF